LCDNYELNKLDCHSSRIEDIIFPSLDYEEELEFEQLDLGNNSKLNYAEINRRFLKYLPGKLDNKISPIDPKELKKITKEEVKTSGEIKEIEIFKT